jgi:hypothetical protein
MTKRKTRPDLKDAAAIETMADDMRVVITRTGSVTKDDLFQIGWTSAQVTLYGDRAREMAVRLSMADAA